MKRQVLDSECIASMRYSAKRRELEIEYRENREVYRYFDVPPEEYAAFMAAESKGTYLNQMFKSKNYRYIIVKHGKKRA